MRFGATDEQIARLEDWRNGPFSDAEKIAFECAERLTLAPRTVDDALLARMREFYDDGEIVEIVSMAGFFNYLNRFAESLDIAPTKPGEGLEDVTP